MESQVWSLVRPYFIEYIHSNAEHRSAKLKQALTLRRLTLLHRMFEEWTLLSMPALVPDTSSPHSHTSYLHPMVTTSSSEMFQAFWLFHIGRPHHAQQTDDRKDDTAGSLQGRLEPTAVAAMAPVEHQGRGFVHAHTMVCSKVRDTKRRLPRMAALIDDTLSNRF